jgi:hypothetical protein
MSFSHHHAGPPLKFEAGSPVTYHKLADGNLTQDWSNSSLISSANNWSGVPSIKGFADIKGAHDVDVDPRTLTGKSEDVDVAANVFKSPSMFNPNGFHKGGVTEFQDFGMVALAGSKHADAPNLVFYLDTTGIVAPVTVDFDVQDLDGSGHDAVQQLNVQYRVGETGPWINVPGGYFADVTEPNSTPTTHVSVVLPDDALGEEKVQVRVMTTNADGRDEWIGIDNIVVACFVRGTLIRTPYGDIPVETLSIGDQVFTVDGGMRAIKWIGRRAFSARFLSKSSSAAPVLIRANALGDGVPYRDLWVSPEHALYVDGVLVPAINLVNGRTILRDIEGEAVEYFHIELESQGIVLANGAPAETYVNHNNRQMFANWQEYVALYGEDAPAISASGEFERVYECVTAGPRLDAITAEIAARIGRDCLAA